MASFKLVWKSDYYSTTSGNLREAAFTCQNTACLRPIAGTLDASQAIVDYWPKVVKGREFADAPAGIAASASEVHECLSIGAARAAIGLARAVLEATAKDPNIASGSLEKKIEKLGEDGIIGSDTVAAAHAIRLWGNDAAHGDLALEPFEQEDAEEVVALMDEVLNRAYQSPARVARIRESRERRKRGEAGGIEV
jgi:hypothetical protein